MPGLDHHQSDLHRVYCIDDRLGAGGGAHDMARQETAQVSREAGTWVVEGVGRGLAATNDALQLLGEGQRNGRSCLGATTSTRGLSTAARSLS